jgi:ATP phosphoribosyltransferase
MSPTYVRFGAADLGIVGKDTLLEHGADGLYEPLDLNIASCKLMTAGIIGASPRLGAYQNCNKVREYREKILCR